MSIQTGLEEFKAGYPNEDPIDMGKAVRNVNYHMIDAAVISNCQRLVFEEILKYPEGVNDKDIAKNTGLSLSSVNGRRNELVQLGLVVAVGIGLYPDYKGEPRPNLMWGVVIK